MKLLNYIYDFFKSNKQSPMYIYIENSLINMDNVVKVFPEPNYDKDEYKVTLVDVNDKKTYLIANDDQHMFKIINTLAARMDVLNLEQIIKL